MARKTKIEHGRDCRCGLNCAIWAAHGFIAHDFALDATDPAPAGGRNLRAGDRSGPVAMVHRVLGLQATPHPIVFDLNALATRSGADATICAGKAARKRLDVKRDLFARWIARLLPMYFENSSQHSVTKSQTPAPHPERSFLGHPFIRRP